MNPGSDRDEDGPSAVDLRAEAIFRGDRLAIFRGSDRLFAALLGFQWLAGIALASTLSPATWAGELSTVHPHLLASIFLGGAIIALPILLAVGRPGAASTRHAIAAGQSLMGALLIHLTGGRIETHFHVFGSLALLAFYRDWRVLITASAFVTFDHLARGIFWPRSIYGSGAIELWRWAEHAGWVAFEDLFLIGSCVRGTREMRAIAARQAELEVTRDGIERTVRARTAELEAEVAERARAELALRESEARFRALSACSPVGIFTTDEAGLRTYSNARFDAIVGAPRAESIGDLWRRTVHEGDAARVLDSWSSAVAAGGEFEAVFRYRGDSGDDRWLRCRASSLRGARGGHSGLVGTVEDMTDWKRSEERLAYQASHDELTGLPNRAFLQSLLARNVDEARTRGATFSLLLIDLDRFKEINDTFGHHYGDAVLRLLNPRLREALGPGRTIARIGGDEFAAVLPGAGADEAALAAERLLAAVKRPIPFEGRSLDVGASIGIAVFPDHGQEAIELLRLADVAMYAAKRAKGGFALYSPDQSSSTPRRLSLIADLRKGIEADQLRVHYQPKIDLATRRVGGVEALVRWQHPAEGLIQPGQFIPLAEHTGLIRPLGAWVLRNTLRQCRRWHRQGLKMQVSVNLSQENLLDDRVIESILAPVSSTLPLPSWLTVEVTESAIMADPGRTRGILDRLHDLGVRISIDDFGTGYSSLAYLKTLPVDEVKIDRGFVRDMTSSEKDACIVRAVIDLGHNLGLRVVAEGVEDRESLELLTAWGCDEAQGFYFSRPLCSEGFLDWLGRAEIEGARDFPRIAGPVPAQTVASAAAGSASMYS